MLCLKYLGRAAWDVRIVPQWGAMHSVLHTAGLPTKPHYCKLPQFTLSIGASKRKKDSLDFWEIVFSRFDYAVTMHLPHAISFTYCMKLNVTASSRSLKNDFALLQFLLRPEKVDLAAGFFFFFKASC